MYSSNKLQELKEGLKSGENILIEELWDSPKALVAALAAETTQKHVLILTGASVEEIQLYQDFPFFTKLKVLDYPAWETLPTEDIAPSPDVVGDRYKVLERMANATEPLIVVGSLQACLQRLIPPRNFDLLYLSLNVGDTHPFDGVIQHLEHMGYKRYPVASDKGEFAVRGGLIDIYPVNSPDPFRIEFWGDDIETMRIYDPIGQKSIEQVESVEITPALEKELLTQHKDLCTVLDYLGKEAMIIFDDVLALEDRYASLMGICGKPTKSFSGIEDFMQQLEPLQKVFWCQQPIDQLGEVKLLEKIQGSFYSATAPMHKISFPFFQREFLAKRWRHPFLPLVPYLLPSEEEPTSDDILRSLNRVPDEAEVQIVCHSQREKEAIKQRLHDMCVQVSSKVKYVEGYLTTGFVLTDSQLVMLPDTEITHRYKIRRQKQRSTYHTVPTEVYQLEAGDTVVHFHHGIGKYLGMELRPNNEGVMSEFFMIEYQDKAKLYVPLSQSYLVSKYIGSHEETPKLHAIGGTRWKRTKERTEKAIMGYANDLLEMYAKREIKGGFSFPEDSEDIPLFEEEFPFIETQDQLDAVKQIKVDMKCDKPMDRLVCGDVGYGKTEVAMRAAFKCVVDGGKQVALLVPTTVLAMQHFETFQERMRHFPVNVGVLSRFRTQKEMRQTLEGIAKGSVDILIGTHRIISKDVSFKDLGLVIIDEEQRFGVRAKEHLKKIKTGVDCLTLSATPIPRTLYMSLIGARDMSVINTPPQDRLPIKSVICESNDQVIKNALQRELARDGQAFFIHNRVETIYDVASRIKKLLPQARVVVGHGQMHADEIDSVFHAFKNGDADILVSTTIVENGIDIPNANTILIDRADMFGLADLYQLRGRVGRWNRRAYGYFLVASMRALPQISLQRMQALAESSGYGGGMKLAMRDLEIRGAGDILGTEQSGQVSSVGFHLYCKLLKRTIKAMQGKMPHALTETKMEFQVDARLPADYVNDTTLRIEFYHRFGEAQSIEEVVEVWNELKDRFGKPPEPAHWLYHLTQLRVFASRNGFSKLRLSKTTLYAEWGKQNKTMILSPPKDPKKFEDTIIHALKNNFLKA